VVGLNRSAHRTYGPQPIRILGHALLIAAVATLFLAKPWPGDLRGRLCVTRMQIAPGLGFPFVFCDSPEFLRVAAEPSRLLQPQSPRQSRPLYPVAAGGAGRLVRTIFRGDPCAERHPFCNPFYLGYTALNFVVLLASLELFRRLIGGWTPSGVMLALGLLANEVVKVFFWTPHTQLFAVLGPLACVAACRYGMHRPALPAGAALVFGLASGLASLAYGTFLLLPVCFAAGALAARSGRPRALVAPLVWVSLGFVVPLVAWWAVVVASAGSFYSDETARFRHVVWIVDAARMGWDALGNAVAAHLRQQARSAWTATWHLAALLAAALVLAGAQGARLAALDGAARRTLAGVAITMPIFFVFLTSLGRHPTRLGWNLAPLLLLAAAVLIDRARRRMGRRGRTVLDAAVSAWALGWLVWEFRSGYPFA
jgi:hypothetical protein